MQQRLDEARKVLSDNDAARTKGHSTANYQTHKVRRGQTLSGIAHQYNVSLNELRHANGIKGSELRIGQTLRVPAHYRLHRVSSGQRSEEHTSELQSLMRISYAVFCLKKRKHKITTNKNMSKRNNKKHKYKTKQ